MPKKSVLSPEHTPIPGFYVDSRKQDEADAINLANGTTSWIRICAARGMDFDKIMQEREKANAALLKSAPLEEKLKIVKMATENAKACEELGDTELAQAIMNSVSDMFDSPPSK